ncbi:MAG TPA: uridine diphosphate-N-acetylglucosamine-binding protein YvcK [Ktedonobacterales bacterium]|nr:uridine diphosphate-N-acetylglucosamine-binding protein YvcK [Ktedonobacterales bacterium]
MTESQRAGQQRQRRRTTVPPIAERLRDKRVVTIGGGTGPFALLSQLKHHPCAVTAIVSMADSGGSSRRLMDEFGQLPLGDLRQALVALSRKGRLWRDLFAYRFREVEATEPASDASASASANGGVGGHSLGNLMIAALQNLDDGNLLWAIQDAQEILDTAGSVLPVTLDHATLVAELDDGTKVRTESEIDTRGEKHPEDTRRITRILLEDETPPCGEAIRAIRRADIIILGPGDLYTSVLPSLLVQGVAEAVRASEAQKVYVCNLMTKHGETDGFRASDFVAEVHRYLGGRVDRAILHDGSFPDDLLELYAAQHQHPVEPDVEAVEQLVPDVAVDRLLAVHAGHLVRHDPERLLRAVLAPALAL